MKTLSLFAFSVSVFLMPIQGLIFTMIIFLIADTVTGIYASIKLNGIKSFCSTKFFNLVVKSFFYLSTIIMAFFIDKYMFDSHVMGVPLLWSKGMTAVWVYTEIKSIDETSMKLGNKSFWVILKEFIERLKGFKKDLNEVNPQENGE